MSTGMTGLYRSFDSPNNFAVRVKIWKVTTGNIVPSATRVVSAEKAPPNTGEHMLEMTPTNPENDEETEEVVIHWQEKLFSEREFVHYSDPVNCLTPVDTRYHEDIVKIKSGFGERSNRRIFTYTDVDSFTGSNMFSGTALNENDYGSYLVQQVEQVRQRQLRHRSFSAEVAKRRLVIEKPTEATRNQHVITTPMKSMFIMVDLGVLSQQAYAPDERVVCSIKMNANGLIEIKPDIEVRDVFALEAYHSTRIVYQVSLEHASTPIRKADKEREANLFKELYSRHADLMHSQVGSEFSPCLMFNEFSVYVVGEIISARNFEYNNLHVQYYLDLPEGWESRGSHQIGLTQSCKMNDKNVAFFSYPIEFELKHTFNELEGKEHLKWPVLYLLVASIDSWLRYRIEGYGFCQIPDVAGSVVLEIGTWRPTGDGLRPALNRYFIGGSPELQDWSHIKGTPGAKGERILSKFYFKTVSSGSISIRLNTVFQHARGKQGMKLSKSEVFNNKAKASGVALEGLAYVLDAFHNARKRMLAARATLPSLP